MQKTHAGIILTAHITNEFRKITSLELNSMCIYFQRKKNPITRNNKRCIFISRIPGKQAGM